MKIIQILLILSTLFCYQKALSQFKTAFDIQNENIKVVYFEADQVSYLNIETQNKSRFQMTSSSEGSYKNDLYFDYTLKQDSLFIKSIYPKRLEYGDNKMTSTQEFSVSVDLRLPENLTLIIDSDLASVSGEGRFKNFQLNTKSGHCFFKSFYGNADVSTYNGDINLKTQDAKVEAFSQNGIVEIYDFLIQKNQINLKSVNGDIIVNQME